MNYRQLGSSGVRVSELCLGAMTFGEADASSAMHKISADAETSFAIMNRAVELGINFIDTADVYGQDGLSERVIGDWFAQGKRRDEVVLATKFRFTMGGGANKSGASRYRIVKCVEESLRRLKTDRIDLYQIHCQDMTTPEEETLRALDDLVRSGKVLYIGCSNYTGARLTDSAWISKTAGLHHYVTLQAQYSLTVRDLERELLPVCASRGIGVLAWSPLAGGFLSGKYRKGQEPPAGSRLDKWRERLAKFDDPRNWRILDALDKVAAETGASLTSVALGWLLGRPAVTAVIFGARTVAQLDDNVKATELSLTAPQRQLLDDASVFEVGYPYAFIGGVSGGRW
jgi:aryl-alcohol dehydrogenase-like predicted oxidoreductase